MPYKDPEKQRQAQHRSYIKHRIAVGLRQKSSRDRTRNYIWHKKIESGGCIKCGEKHPAALDFHHRDPSKKEITINGMLEGKYGPAKIDIEMQKCDVLCSNCHRKLHWEQNGICEYNEQTPYK